MNSDDKNIDEWIEKNKSQRKALETIIHSIENKNREKPDPNMTQNQKRKKNIIMNKLTQLFKKLGLLILPALLAGSVHLHAQNSGFVPGKIRVKIESGSVELVAKSLSQSETDNKLKTGLQSVDKLNAKYNARKMTRVFPYAGKKEAKHIQYGLNLWYEIRVDNETDLKKASEAYAATGAILVAEPVREKVLDYKNMGEVDPADAISLADSPVNDPYLLDQWHYHNDGSLPNSKAGSDINLFDAWKVTAGNPNVVVAVVDGGIDVKHVDLAENVWLNEAELNGEPGIDDDFNGYIDDIHGFNFTTGKGEITAHDHGTHVSGTIAAVNNNGRGVAGVAGGTGNHDGVKVISCQVFSNNEGGGNFAAAIVYGADNGAVISQNSWGYSNPGHYEQAVLDAIDYFIAEAGNYPNSPMRGGVVLFAAGNNGDDQMHYPGYYESPVTVASIGTDFKRANYSNYGDWIDIATVGGNAQYGTKSMVLSTMPGNKYGYMQGTSMATPHASGVAALIVSKYGSPNFSNEDLKKHLLTGVRDINSYNPDFEGKLGVGYIDATMALAANDNQGPATIADLEVTGVSQDFANLEWTVPADAQDGNPVKYFLYVSKEVTFSDKTVIEIDNDFRNVGDIIQQEVQKLEPITQYYFAVVSADRWGNLSEMSNIVDATTNEGPDINTDKSNISLNIDINETLMVQDTLKILNENDGVLRWEAETREVRATPSYNKVDFPKAGTQVQVDQLDVKQQIIDKIKQFKSNEAAPDAWEASEKRYYESLQTFVIGENDTTVTNSSAIHFFVNEEEGFNLTRISAYYRIDKEDGPFIIEVYKNELSKENLMYVGEVKGYAENDSRNFSHNLTEQLFFKKGESFWIVTHAPAGNLYPLGISPALDTQFSDYCKMSFDLGKTWVPLEAAMGSNYYVWRVKASSSIEPLHKYVTLDPESGLVQGMSNQDMQLDVDASELINGKYTSNIVINSNDTDEPIYRVPMTVNVAGHKPVLSSTNILDFGSVFTGLSETKEMFVKNTGYGRFKTRTIISSDPQFKVETKTYALNIPALDEKPLVITFTPNGTGNQNAVITMTSYNGDVYKFNVFGVGADPARIEVAPDVFTYDNVMIGDTIQDTIRITNVGKYPLQYGFPNFTNDLSHIENLPKHVQRYGYVMEKMDYPADFVYNDISGSGTEITDFFNASPNNEFYKLDLGFDFPYFGKTIKSLYVTKKGALTLDTESGNFNSTSEFLSDRMPDGYIAALINEYALSKAGGVFVKRDLGKIIIQFHNVRHDRDSDNVSIDFQIELRNNGDILFIYDRFDGVPSYKLRSYYTAIENTEQTDGVLINSSYDKVYLSHKPHQIVYVHSPGIGLIKDVVEAKGMIQPGETKELTMTLDSEKMIEGSFKEYIAVVSNDPFESSKMIEVNINIVGGGTSELVVAPERVDLGNVFMYADKRGVVTAKNVGTRQLTINAVSFEKDQLIYNGEQNIVIAPNQTLYIEYSLKTDQLADVNDKLMMTDTDGNIYEVTFTGKVIDAPDIAVAESTYEVILASGEKTTRQFKVTNTGKSDLDYALAGSSMVSINEAAPDEVPEFTYVVRSTYDSIKPAYRWYNLAEEDKVLFNNNQRDFWEEIDLPFEFTFYNEKYSKLWMGYQGVLSFDKIEDESKLIFVPPTIPNDDELNNLIAPYFAAGGDNTQLPADQYGRYMKVFEDKVVFEYRGYIDIFGMGSVYSFQAILYKNGNIKFQYKYPMGGRAATNRGLIGLENKGGTDAVQMAYYQPFFDDGVAVEFIPAVKHTLKPNTSKDFDLTISAVGIDADVYDQEISVTSNSPLHPSISVPVNVTVTGDPVLTFDPEQIDLGEVILMPNTRIINQYKMLNTGTKKLSVANFRMEDATDAVIEQLIYHPRFGYRWVPLRSTDTFELNPGENISSLRVVITPKAATDQYANAILADTDFGTTVQLPITGVVKLPPNFTVNDEEIYYMAYNNDVYSHVLNLGNTEGQSGLEYNLSLNYDRKDAIAAKNPQSTKKESVLMRNTADLKPVANKAAMKADFAKILQHEHATAASTSLGFNGANVLVTSTAFTAPKEGFKLSHVQTWYLPGEWLNSEINIEIRVGDYVDDAKVIHTDLVNYTISEPDNNGSLITLALSNEVVLLPYERFYVVISYPLGALYPQGVAEVSEAKSGIFKYFSDGKWWDIADSSFREYGWIVRAAEQKLSELNWIDFDQDLLGTVPAGEVLDMTVSLYPEKAMYVHNTANINILTNDPQTAHTTIPVTMDINQGPTLALKDKYYVNEAETLTVDAIAEDNEGDLIVDAHLAQDYENASIVYEDGVATFTYTPGYEDAGMHSYDVVCTDEHGIKATSMINVVVINTNRAPEAKTFETIYMNLRSNGYRIAYDDIIKDPDGEVLTFKYQFSDDNIAEIYESDVAALVRPLKIGNTTLDVTGIDPEGATASTKINFVVGNDINDDKTLENSWKVHPNPVGEIMIIKLYNPIVERVDIRIYNSMGSTVKSLWRSEATEMLQIPVADLKPGVYFVELKTKGARSVKKIVKN